MQNRSPNDLLRSANSGQRAPVYTELMLLWFHLVFNLNTKHDIITTNNFGFVSDILERLDAASECMESKTMAMKTSDLYSIDTTSIL